MTVLQNFNHFGAAHWETGSVRHILNYQGANLSEAMLLGLTSGICVGYFSFAYEGFDPHVALLTRNTFDPVETMLDRLGVVREVRQTPSAEKGEKNVCDALEEDRPVMVFADMYSLAYNVTPTDDGMWVFIPLVVYGLDSKSAYISDRSNVPLVVSAKEFSTARGRTKNNKYKMMTLDLPNLDKLPRAIQAGIESCIRLYTEAPPKGARTNFGFAALDHWAELLVSKSHKNSWAKVFPQGRCLYAGLVSTYNSIEVFGTGGHASRDQYADFLDEAATILAKPALKDAGSLFRKAASAWDDLAVTLLPDSVSPFRETRQMIDQNMKLFKETGSASIPERQANRAKLQQMKAEMDRDFPLDERGCDALLGAIREKVLIIRDIERQAVAALGQAML